MTAKFRFMWNAVYFRPHFERRSQSHMLCSCWLEQIQRPMLNVRRSWGHLIFWNTCFGLKMKPKTNGNMQRAQGQNCVQGEGPNWILIAGGALLCTLSIRIGHRLKHTFNAKRSINGHNPLKGNEKYVAQRRNGTCKLHSNLYCYSREDVCYQCLSGNLNGEVAIKHASISQISKDGDHSLPLVKMPTPGSNKENNNVMWALSPDCLELPHGPFHRSNSSDFPSFSESGSDIYSKREVIQKLRHQLKKRDEMIIEMQTQITDLQNSLSVQMTHSSHLQAQIDSSNRDLFDSEREIQRLRKAIADHCVVEAMNGGGNGYRVSVDDVGVCCVGVEKGRGGGEKVEMLKREVGDLKEVIEGKDFLLQSYKEQKVELSAKVKELQMKLASQVPNIL